MTSVLPTDSSGARAENSSALRTNTPASSPAITFDSIFKGLNYKDLALQVSSLSKSAAASDSATRAGVDGGADRERAAFDQRQERQSFTADERAESTSKQRPEPAEKDRAVNRAEESAAEGDVRGAEKSGGEVAATDDAQSTGDVAVSAEVKAGGESTGAGEEAAVAENSAIDSGQGVDTSQAAELPLAPGDSILAEQAQAGALTGEQSAAIAAVDSKVGKQTVAPLIDGVIRPSNQDLRALLPESPSLHNDAHRRGVIGNALKDVFSLFASPISPLAGQQASGLSALDGSSAGREVAGLSAQGLSSFLGASGSSLSLDSTDSPVRAGQDLNLLMAQFRGALTAAQSNLGAFANGLADAGGQSAQQSSVNPATMINPLNNAAIPLPMQLGNQLNRVLQSAGQVEGVRADAKIGAIAGTVTAAPGLQASGSTQSGPQPVAGSTLNLASFQASTMNQGDWPGEFAGKLKMMLSQRMQTAELQLNPAGLGNLQVKIEGADEQAKVFFSVQSGLAKEQIEMHMPRLRELMASSQIDLGDVHVQDQSAGGDHQGSFASSSEQSQDQVSHQASSDVQREPSNTIELKGRVGDQLLDTYA